MGELVIKSKTERGYRGKTAVVISLDTATKEKIDSIALSTGHSFNEIVDMLLQYSLANCKIEETERPAPVTPATPPSTPPAKSRTTRNTATKALDVEEVAIPTPAPTPTRAARTIAATKTIATDPSEEKPSRTIAAKTTAKTIEAPAEEKPAPAPRATRSTAKSKTQDIHSAVPTFKLPPITKGK